MGLEARNIVEAGANKTLDRLGHQEGREGAVMEAVGKALDKNSQKKMERIAMDAKDLATNMRGPKTDAERIRRDMMEGKVNSMSDLMRAEEELKQIALKDGEKTLKEVIDQDEDEAISYSKDWLGYMKGMDISGMAQELKVLKEGQSNLAKHKKELEELKRKSPRAFKEYCKAAKEEKNRNILSKTRKELLKEIKSTYTDVIKAPLSVQGEFFKMVDKKEVKDGEYEKALQKLTTQDHKKKEEYKGKIDDKIFGKKPAKEFKTWIDERKNFEELDYALSTLKNQYIPERKAAQKEFEDLPTELTKEHQQNWEDNLGYSERRSLLDSLQQLEKSQENPLAQQHLKEITKHKKEFSPKEWPELTAEFLKLNFQNQELALKAFPFMVLNKRKELTQRFENLPGGTREANNDFFNLDMEEKIARLKDLETVTSESGEGENAKDIGNILDTDRGRSVYAEKLRMIMQTQRGRGLQVADILAEKTLQDQQRSGKIAAEERQLKTVHEKAGEEAEDKVSLVQEMTDGKVTIHETSGEEKDIHTMDLHQLRQGSLQETELQAVRRELREEGVTNRREDRYSRAKFVQREGQREIDLSKNLDQRGQLEEMVQEMLRDALMMAAESMTGMSVKQEDLSKLSDERSQQMLNQYREITKRQFHGMEGVTARAA